MLDLGLRNGPDGTPHRWCFDPGPDVVLGYDPMSGAHLFTCNLDRSAPYDEAALVAACGAPETVGFVFEGSAGRMHLEANERRLATFLAPGCPTMPDLGGGKFADGRGLSWSHDPQTGTTRVQSFGPDGALRGEATLP